jgi:hypothetical protein
MDSVKTSAGSVIFSTDKEKERMSQLLQQRFRQIRLLIEVFSVTAVSVLGATPGHAHERGAPFSSAIIDPVVTHHAHIENE